jgi:hypothetical protein
LGTVSASPWLPAAIWNRWVALEADETELARSRKTKRPADFRRKTHNPIVMSLVERGGDIRSALLDHRSAMGVVRKNVHPDTHLVTDTTSRYKFAPVAKHEAVDHSKFECPPMLDSFSFRLSL